MRRSRRERPRVSASAPPSNAGAGARCPPTIGMTLFAMMFRLKNHSAKGPEATVLVGLLEILTLLRLLRIDLALLRIGAFVLLGCAGLADVGGRIRWRRGCWLRRRRSARNILRHVAIGVLAARSETGAKCERDRASERMGSHRLS